MGSFVELIAAPVLKIIDKIIPDPQAKAVALLELEKLRQSGELAQLNADLQQALAQSDVNKAEAASASVFVSGWRPFVGWMCGCGLGFQIVVAPLAEWAANLAGHPVAFPPLDTSVLGTMLMGMLGLGGMRTYEKISGVARK